VAAHVHHVQDVAAGLLLGLAAGLVAVLITRAAAPRVIRSGRVPVAKSATDVRSPRA
jgi:membrane-associated phospholipid phosphatase